MARQARVNIMNAIRTNDRPNLHAAVRDLVDRHGARAILLAVLGRIVSRPGRTRSVDELSDHLRRDIGLPPRQEPFAWVPPVRGADVFRR